MKRLIDANSVLRSIDVNGSAYDGSEYQAYKAGVEYVRSLIEDAPDIKPESMRHDEEWISVKDRLPDVFDEVLVYDTFSNTSISIAWRETTPRKNGIVNWYWNSQMSYPENLTHVTHWMPLPEPPTKQTKGE
jgi:hypothetical protein|nr:MAG TPA: Protein of unknown function (DUF551) [Bacteriophage sp.]